MLQKINNYGIFNINDPVIVAYLDSREHKAYFLSLKHVGPRRRAHKDLINSFTNFFELVETKEAQEKINKLFFSSNLKRKKNTQIQDISQLAKEIDPDGYELLKIGDSLDLEKLKSLYKKAAKRFHPDMGGSHEEMLVVNRAYIEFHELLCQIEEGGFEDEDGWDYEYKIKSIKDYLYVIGILLVKIYMDDWVIDKAFLLIKKMNENNFYDYKLTWEYEFELFPILKRLWLRLKKAKLNEESEYVYEIINELFLKRKERKYRPKVEKGKSSPLILTHLERAKNAFRLGLIDESKLNLFKKKNEEEKKLELEGENRLINFLKEKEFLQDLPSDKEGNREISNKKLIPEPGYFKFYLLELSKDQQAEYFKAFSKGTNIKLIEKYLFVRLQSLLESVILYYSEDMLKKCIEECKSLRRIIEINKEKHGGHSWVGTILRFLVFFKKLDKKDREERIFILKTLHEKNKTKSENIDEETNVLTMGSGPVFNEYIISVNFEYFQKAKSSILKLRKEMGKYLVLLKKRSNNQ